MAGGRWTFISFFLDQTGCFLAGAAAREHRVEIAHGRFPIHNDQPLPGCVTGLPFFRFDITLIFYKIKKQ
jgi:hypothetical protein